MKNYPEYKDLWDEGPHSSFQMRPESRLTAEEEAKYRKAAQLIFKNNPGVTIYPYWHVVIQDELRKLKAEREGELSC